MLHGEKLWMVGRDRQRPQYTNSTSCVGSFKDALRQETEADDWDWDCIHAKKGDTILMRPGTPHAVLTMQSSVCSGEYMITTATISAATTSFIITYFTNSSTTNDTFDENLNLFQSLSSWWWQHGINPESDVIIPYVRRISPRLDDNDDLQDLLAVIAIVVYNTVFALKKKKKATNVMERDWIAAARLHEHIAKSGVVEAHGDTLPFESGEPALDAIKAVIVHFGCALVDFVRRSVPNLLDAVSKEVATSLLRAYGKPAEDAIQAWIISAVELPLHTPFPPSCSLQPHSGTQPAATTFYFFKSWMSL